MRVLPRQVVMVDRHTAIRLLINSEYSLDRCGPGVCRTRVTEPSPHVTASRHARKARAASLNTREVIAFVWFLPGSVVTTASGAHRVRSSRPTA